MIIITYTIHELFYGNEILEGAEIFCPFSKSLCLPSTGAYVPDLAKYICPGRVSCEPHVKKVDIKKKKSDKKSYYKRYIGQGSPEDRKYDEKMI